MAYWTLVIFAFCFVGISALSGKGYYCRDPDTGKLYPVNSTWPSTTFCGNYSCKLRKKDTVKPVIPLREIMIDSIAKNTQARKSDDSSIKIEQLVEESPNKLTTTINPTLLPEASTKQSTFSTKNKTNIQKIESNDKEIKSMSSEHGDRYLTEGEIKTISHILHSVKKSDLEAIVDIYNLAQDIYKEMDKITSENIIDETLKAAKTKKKESITRSYWYEPLNRLNKAGAGSDMESQGTNLYPTVTERSTIDPNSYFQGVLSKSDFGAVPYHYPMSNFQREHSYVHATRSPQVNPVGYERTPCRQSVQYPNYPVTAPSAYQSPVTSYYQYQPSKTYSSNVKHAYPVETQKVIQPSMLLPYPFSYIQHYNMSTYPYNLYYDGSPWSYFNINNKNNDNNEKYFKANLQETPKNVYDIKIETEPYQTNKESELNQNTEIKRYTSNKETETNKNNEGKPYKTNSETKQKGQVKTKLLDTLFEQAKLAHKNKPDWQTDPLTSNVLEEIKAHFDEKAKLLKPFSLRKKAKLERVGKVVKLDDLNRDKRDADNLSITDIEFDEDLEAFVEKTTCPSQTDLGFYKIGNLTQPFPACCPRRIESNEKD